MFTNAEPVLECESLVLVTGVSGFIGSHIADKLLEAGYRVRGLTRNIEKNGWIANLLQKKYGRDKFELIPADLTQPLENLLKGVSGVIHSASDMTYRPDPNEVITPTVAIGLNIFNAAAKTPSVKRFVFTSSCASAVSPNPKSYPTVTSSTWNDEAILQAWASAPYEASRGFSVYAASKTQTEKALWDAYKEKTGFIFNTVLPAANMGRSLDTHQGHPSTSGLLQALFMNDTATVSNGPQYFYVDVEDTARLHVAALLHPSIRDERIFAYAAPYTWRGIQKILRELYPERDFVEMAEAPMDESVIVPRSVAEGYLRMMGRDGWTGLTDCVRMNTEDLA